MLSGQQTSFVLCFLYGFFFLIFCWKFSHFLNHMKNILEMYSTVFYLLLFSEIVGSNSPACHIPS